MNDKNSVLKTNNKTKPKHIDPYENVIEQALVSMVLRVGYIQIKNNLKDTTESIDDQNCDQDTNLFYQLCENIDSCINSLNESKIAQTLYNNKPKIRFISDSPIKKPKGKNTTSENAIIFHQTTGQPLQSQNLALSYCEDVVDKTTSQNFINREIAMQTDLLVIETSGFNETETIKFINNLHIPHSLCIFIISNNESYGIYSPQKINSINDASALNSKILVELNKILLFPSFLNEDELIPEKQKKKLSVTVEVLNRFKAYQSETLLEYSDDNDTKINFTNSGPIKLTKHLINWTNLFDKFILFLSNKPKTENNQHNENLKIMANNSGSNKLFAHFLRADRLAIHYANAHRSTYILIYILGAFALIAAVIAVAFHGCDTIVLYAAIIEFLILNSIFFLYYNDHNNHYHIKWLDYRSLAEILRMTPQLNALGIMPELNNFEKHYRKDGCNDLTEKNAGRPWIMIYTKCVLRWVGFNQVLINKENLKISQSFLSDNFITEQIAYHKKNAINMKHCGEKLGRVSKALFILALFFVFFKLVLKAEFDILSWLPHNLGHYLGICAAIAPIIGSAAFAIRNHAEFEISSQRSSTMIKSLENISYKLTKTIVHYKHLAAHISYTSAIMKNETAGWLEIYEVKETEPG